jgi:hypothetical protein
MSKRIACLPLVTLLFACWGCQEQQYVNPDTVKLSVSRAGGATLVDRCNYIPVLLGGAAQFTYHVERDLGVHLQITRDKVLATFEDSSGRLGSFGAPSSSFADDFSVDASEPPDGYSATLSAGCVPSPEWPDR